MDNINLIKLIIKEEIKSLAEPREIVLPISLIMPDFSCPCEPDDLGRMYVLDYNVSNQVRGIKGVSVFIKDDNGSYIVTTSPLKMAKGGLGPRQHAVYDNLKRKIFNRYCDELSISGWARNNDPEIKNSFVPPWNNQNGPISSTSSASSTSLTSSLDDKGLSER